MKKFRIFFGTVALACMLLGCKKTNECTEGLLRRIAVGDVQARVVKVLDGCGYTWSFDQKTNTIYALKRGRRTGLVIQSWKAEIQLDDARKVSAVKVEKAFTGP